MERSAEDTPANQAGSSESAGQPGTRRFCSERTVRILDGGGWPQGREEPPRREARRHAERTAGCGRQSPESDRRGCRLGSGSHRNPTGNWSNRNRRQGPTGASRVIRIHATEPSGAGIRAQGRIRNCTSEHRRIRREDAVGGTAHSEPREVDRRRPGGYSGLRRAEAPSRHGPHTARTLGGLVRSTRSGLRAQELGRMVARSPTRHSRRDILRPGHQLRARVRARELG